LTTHGTAPWELEQLVIESAVVPTGADGVAGNNIATVVAASLPSGARVYDTFDRSNGAAGKADTGQQWVSHAAPLRIADGRAALDHAFLLSSVDAGSSMGDMRATVHNPGGEFWIIFRLSDSSNYWRFGRWPGEAYQLQRIMANAATVYARMATLTPAEGDLLRCIYAVDQIECSVNGVAVARVTDSFNETATRIGLSGAAAGATQFDELLVGAPPPITDAAVSVTGPRTLRAHETGTWQVAVRNRGTVPIP